MKASLTTLVIPDIHEQHGYLEGIEPLIERAERVVFLGDHFDTFGMPQPERTYEAILKYIDNPKVTMLLGNHDCHYAFDNQGFLCSGFREPTRLVVERELGPEVWRKFRLWAKVGDYLVSHAGFHQSMIGLSLNDDGGISFIEEALAGDCPSIFRAGWARGGRQPVGGCTWLDWNDEFSHIYGRPQIVGHTQGNKVRKKGLDDERPSYCVDTGLRHVLWTDGDTVEIEEVNR